MISDSATAAKLLSNAPVSFWPQLVSNAVDIHNVTTCALGSSTSDSQISAYQRFTLKQPKCMDLLAFGSRTVVLKPPEKITKSQLDGRGWVGCWLGRSRSSIGSWDVWVPSEHRIVTSSSCLADEEHFPWRGKDAYMPLSPTIAAAPKPLAASVPSAKATSAPSVTQESTGANARVPTELHFLNLFSGKYKRSNGLSQQLTQLGWSNVQQIDNDAEDGGGWAHDLSNDSLYAVLLDRATRGDFHGVMIAFPCSTFSIARFFDASDETHDSGPPPVRTAQHPDGLPPGRIDPRHSKELKAANILLDRAVEVAIAARNSTARATIVSD